MGSGIGPQGQHRAGDGGNQCYQQEYTPKCTLVAFQPGTYQNLFLHAYHPNSESQLLTWFSRPFSSVR